MALYEDPYDPNAGHLLVRMNGPGGHYTGPLEPGKLPPNQHIITNFIEPNYKGIQLFKLDYYSGATKTNPASNLGFGFNWASRVYHRPRLESTLTIEGRRMPGAMLPADVNRGYLGLVHGYKGIDADNNIFVSKIIKPWHTNYPLEMLSYQMLKQWDIKLDLRHIAREISGTTALTAIEYANSMPQVYLETIGVRGDNPLHEGGHTIQFNGGMMVNPVNYKVPSPVDYTTVHVVQPYSGTMKNQLDFAIWMRQRKQFESDLFRGGRSYPPKTTWFNLGDTTSMTARTRNLIIYKSFGTSVATQLTNIYGHWSNHKQVPGHFRNILRKVHYSYTMVRGRQYPPIWFNAPLFIFGRVFGGVTTVFAPRVDGRVNGDWSMLD